MLSVAGLPEQLVCEACPQLQLECAIRIAADHVVLAGEDAALQAAQAALAARGATCKRLAVQVPSHTSWMQPAVAAFAQRLEAVPFQPARCPVALNATGATARRADALRAALSQQIGATVQWGDCMDAVAERGPHCVLEIGPGHALARLWTTRHPGIPARSVEDFREAAAVAAWVVSQG
jgi:[acyl-carrier-protein] S-malonyltransferase